MPKHPRVGGHGQETEGANKSAMFAETFLNTLDQNCEEIIMGFLSIRAANILLQVGPTGGLGQCAERGAMKRIRNYLVELAWGDEINKLRETPGILVTDTPTWIPPPRRRWEVLEDLYHVEFLGGKGPREPTARELLWRLQKERELSKGEARWCGPWVQDKNVLPKATRKKERLRREIELAFSTNKKWTYKNPENNLIVVPWGELCWYAGTNERVFNSKVEMEISRANLRNRVGQA